MIVRIPKEDLRLGMYIESVECIATEFSKKRFPLLSKADLQLIKASSAEWININVRFTQMRSQSTRDISLAEREVNQVAVARVKSRIQESTIAIEVALTEIVASSYCDFAAFSRIVDKIGDAVDTSPAIFNQLTRLKRDDELTYAHSLSVSGLMLQLALALDLDAASTCELGVSGIVHDVGKLLLPQPILQKPSALTGDEMATMKRHPVLGYELLSANSNLPPMVLDVCRHHHEHIDGSGYPDGISGSAVSTASRIAAICDVFDALTTKRPYKSAWSTHEALRWMFDREGKFDRKILLRFAEVVAP